MTDDTKQIKYILPLVGKILAPVLGATYMLDTNVHRRMDSRLIIALD